MSPLSSRPPRTLLAGLYLLGALLILQPLAEWVVAVWPPRFGQESWRYGMLGMLSGTLLTPILGLVLMGAVAGFAKHRGISRFLALIAVIAGPLLLLSCGAFALDAVQLRLRVPQDGQIPYLLESARTLLRVGAAGLVLTVLGIGGLRDARRGSGRNRSKGSAATPPLLASA